jgi:hypothetical protein
MSARLFVELLWRRYGWPLAMGVIILAAGLMAALVAGWPVQQPQTTVAAVDGTRQLLARHRSFREVLIPATELDALQLTVLESAAQHQLTLGRIDYSTEPNAAGRFAVVSLQMPVRGRYTDLRAFLDELLQTRPALAIEDLALQRDPSGKGLDAHLRLAIYTETAAREAR